MKFARYLEETQIPEWRKAYIDYRAIKRSITTIREAIEAAQDPGHARTSSREGHQHSDVEENCGIPSPTGFHGAHDAQEYESTLPAAINDAASECSTWVGSHGLGEKQKSPLLRSGTIAHHPTGSRDTFKDASEHTSRAQRRQTLPARIINNTLALIPARARDVAHPESSRHLFSGVRRRFTQSAAHNISKVETSPATIQEMLAGLGSNELAFFQLLDHEIEKASAQIPYFKHATDSFQVDQFYIEHELDAIREVTTLKEQFEELRDHKKLLNERQGLWPSFLSFLDSVSVSGPSRPNGAIGETQNKLRSRAGSKAQTPRLYSQVQRHPEAKQVHDAEAYTRAKKKIKKAVLEFYRGLEFLQNFRILNMTGFRKALKKFDKSTKMSIQDMYMRERVENRSFASAETCTALLRDIERIYAIRFGMFTRDLFQYKTRYNLDKEDGDEKKARTRLRAAPRQTTHHFSTFRSGLLVGLAAPALGMSLYHLLRPEYRESVPEWGALLQVYAALSIPVIFTLLIGLNLVAWARARINFIFIFELDVRTVIDSRQYIELPAFLFSTLSYAFWLSFSGIGSNVIPSTHWPIIWVSLAVAVLVNPFPIFHRPARWWFLCTLGNLFVSGWVTRVEFADFWMGDQLCSLVYTLSHLYFLVCAYVDGWYQIEERCQIAQHWAIPIVLTLIPYTIRLVQCIRRWIDSKNRIHLINGAKYVTVIGSNLAFFGWKHYGRERDFRFIIWIVLATISSIYAYYWDITMDWSLFQVRGVRYKFLRKELAYAGNIPGYYFAIISNLAIRFIWVWYIPKGGLPFKTRAFIFAVLEMLRRIQWNFFRLENEHIGNADQFRVTREVPLPYAFRREAASDDEDDHTEESRPRGRRMSVIYPAEDYWNEWFQS
ncbi:Xenotropic and polytropic retrovirus receptor-like protein [Ceratobasidium theobromae]|uniref:Xenotropic and polytropic retrovirus receptor-like protein n=1 Tax=Ceratobasidium theobromae TaxID=1582974 RepID=A0A5N5QSS1_9AGAM|nr:Xenotropic and polytropic retrovirus receptor-like protein [Ceratobasidium theobromae]